MRSFLTIMTTMLVFLLSQNLAATDLKDQMLKYQTVGNGPEQVIVIHDWLGDKSNYDQVQPFLNTQAFTYAFVDLRGYGESKNIAGKHTAKEAATDVIAVADKLSWKRFHVVGHSMSGMIVQRIAIDSGSRIKSVVAVSPVAASGIAIDEATWDFFVDVVKNKESTGAALALLTGEKLSSSWIDYKVERAMNTSTAQARRDYLDMFVKTDFSAEASGIETPFLVLLGANDMAAFAPEAVTQTFLKWYKNAKLMTIHDAGHYSMQETPALFISLVEAFLTEHSD